MLWKSLHLHYSEEEDDHGHKMKAAQARIRCEEPGKKVEAEKMVGFFMFTSVGGLAVLGECAEDEPARITRGAVEAEGAGLRSHGSKAGR
jgi:hypothetical protein